MTQIDYLSAIEEGKYVIAQANASLDENNRLSDELVSAREGRIDVRPPERIQYMDVAPTQIVSVAASLVPFLEHDDANRALMGANMQRQAVPTLRPEKALVAPVSSASPRRLGHRRDRPSRWRGGLCRHQPHRHPRQRRETVAGEVGVDIYNLIKYHRSNQNTNIHQRPIVNRGDVVKAAGDVIADGASTDLGELAWAEHARRVHALERLQLRRLDPDLRARGRRRPLTSIHIEEYEVMARDTKLGPEGITRDIPNVGGSNCAPGRVGHRLHRRRSRPGRHPGRQDHAEGRDPMTPEEKLLRASSAKGVRREGHLAARRPGHLRHRHRRAGLHP